MDQVFFIIKRHEIYVGEYYQGKIKQVKFKDKDFWEVFDEYDFIEFIEHMNYPMNYKAFKENKIRILYDNPQKYEMLYHTQQLFKEATDLKVGQLLPYIRKAFINKFQSAVDLEEQIYLNYEQTYYAVQFDLDTENRVINFEKVELFEVEDLEDKALRLSTEELCTALFEDDEWMINVADAYPILAPVNIYITEQANEQMKYLETHYTLENLHFAQIKDINKKEYVFSYKKVVNKLFRKKGYQALHKKCEMKGTYYPVQRNTDGTLWAKKNELIGVVTKKDREWLRNWLNQTGFGGKISE